MLVSLDGSRRKPSVLSGGDAEWARVVIDSDLEDGLNIKEQYKELNYSGSITFSAHCIRQLILPIM